VIIIIIIINRKSLNIYNHNIFF